MTIWHLSFAARVLRAGGIVAHPTEAVFGLGCDPLDADAVHRLLELKRRSPRKGLILLAADFRQLLPFVSPSAAEVERAQASWPGPVTWLMTARRGLPGWLTGGRETVAVRVTAHSGAAALCRAWRGPVVSTSANPSGRMPARTALVVRRMFASSVDYVLPGAVGGASRPTAIRVAATGATVRAA